MGGVHGRYCWHKSSNIEIVDTHKVHDHEDCMLITRVPSHQLLLKYAFHTQRGFYPDNPNRQNQDSLCIKTQIQGDPDLHFFGVFDGHGEFGTQCANFISQRLVRALTDDPELPEDPARACVTGFKATNAELHKSSIDDRLSGTTAITVLVCGDTLYVANAGDSRAVAGLWNGGSFVAKDLSSDQTPFRKDECERVKRCGARVLSVGQINGIKDTDVEDWCDEEDPPRLWVQDGLYPGTAFTRSIGDSVAEGIGAIADPEVMAVKITPELRFFVVASDGVFEFLSSEDVVSMVSNYHNPRDACVAVATESYRRWQQTQTRVDDITIIVVHIEDDACDVGASHGYIQILKRALGGLWKR